MNRVREGDHEELKEVVTMNMLRELKETNKIDDET
jgi:hypothetical protein